MSAKPAITIMPMRMFGDDIEWVYEGVSVIAVLKAQQIVKIRAGADEEAKWKAVRNGPVVDTTRRTWRAEIKTMIAELKEGKS